MRIRPALVATLTVLTLGAATACSGGTEPSETAADPAAGSSDTPSTPGQPTPQTPGPSTGQSSSETPPEAPAGPVLTVTIAGDEVSPNGELIELAVGETLTVEVDSDRSGELHVHSKPDQYVEFEAGQSSQEVTVEVPGSIEVEDHDTGDLVAQLQVR